MEFSQRLAASTGWCVESSLEGSDALGDPVSAEVGGVTVARAGGQLVRGDRPRPLGFLVAVWGGDIWECALGSH